MNLVLFFTKGVSLQTWDQVGMFEREVALYCRLHDRGISVTFVTYGNRKDLKYSGRIPEIQILCNQWKLPGWLYRRMIPWLHASHLKAADIFKTNQMNGADVALKAAQIWNKPLIARCGYMWSFNSMKETGEFSIKTRKARNIETCVFNSADRIVVTTSAIASDIEQRFPAVSERITIIPNYVETERFTPSEDHQYNYDVIFVGRLSPEKNLKALLEAIRSLSLRAAIIGEGKLRKEFAQQYADSDTKISFLGNIPNSILPSYLQRAHLFVLPSFYEGHPKTLLEAMACRMAVIGTNSPGIRDIITHGENGWLCETDSESIRNAIRYLLDNPGLCKKLGENARKYVLDTVSLDKVIDMEIGVYKSIIGDFNETG